MIKDKKRDKKNNKQIKGSLSIGWIRVIIAITALILYGSSVKYQFTLDDDIFYLKHNSVQKGLSGTPEIFSFGSMEKFDGTTGEQAYRPITLLSFAIEKEMFNNDATSSHFINVLLYILILQILLSLLIRLFPGIHPLISGIIVLLFAAHPLHSEVVASVKSRDELLAGLFGLMAWFYAIPKNANRNPNFKRYIGSVLCFTIALFSKESVITFALIIPLSHYMLLSGSLKNSISKALGYFGVAILFILLRSSIVGTTVAESLFPVHENILNYTKGFAEASATRMEILFYYLKLLVIPWPLSWDYSFNQIPVMNWGNMIPWISIILFISLFITAIYYFKKNAMLSFSILFFFISISPISNIFIVNLSTLGERFMFLPSLGYILFVMAVLAAIFKTDIKNPRGSGYKSLQKVALIIILAYSGLSMARAKEWKSNLSLFEAGVQSSANSSRAHYSLATEYTRLAKLARDPKTHNDFQKKALDHFDLSLAIQPTNIQSLYNLGNTQCALGDTSKALLNYKKAVELNPAYLSALNNLSGVYMSRNQVDSALIFLLQGYQYNKQDVELMGNIALVSYFSKKYDQAIEFAKQVISINPKHRKSYGVLIDSYNSLGKTDEAQRFRATRDGIQ